jgi:hypothetical protein
MGGSTSATELLNTSIGPSAKARSAFENAAYSTRCEHLPTSRHAGSRLEAPFFEQPVEGQLIFDRQRHPGRRKKEARVRQSAHKCLE